MKKWSREQKKILRRYWNRFRQLRGDFADKVCELEEEMQNKLGVEELEFCYDEMGMGYYGIGNKWAEKGDKYELWQE